MKEKACFENKTIGGETKRPGTETDQQGLKATPQPVEALEKIRRHFYTLIDLINQLRLFPPEVQVEVSGGVVQNIRLVNTTCIAVKVIVRDYDDLEEDPDGYRDAVWSLGQGRQS